MFYVAYKDNTTPFVQVIYPKHPELSFALRLSLPEVWTMYDYVGIINCWVEEGILEYRMSDLVDFNRKSDRNPDIVIALKQLSLYWHHRPVLQIYVPRSAHWPPFITVEFLLAPIPNTTIRITDKVLCDMIEHSFNWKLFVSPGYDDCACFWWKHRNTGLPKTMHLWPGFMVTKQTSSLMSLPVITFGVGSGASCVPSPQVLTQPEPVIA